MLNPIWDIPLSQPPEIRALGRNAHGFVPRDRQRLDDLWSLHLYGYDAVLRLNGQDVPVHPGTLGIIPPGTVMETRYYGISVHLYAHFRLAPGDTRPVAAVTDLGADHKPVYDELYDAVVRFGREPHWAAARVWNALWKAVSISSAPVAVRRDLHPSVRHATDLIEEGLSNRLSVTHLAQTIGIAPSYLTRLFHEAYGETVIGYIRRRKMERASDLLLRSSLPIKVVASSIGYYDLQQFNKAVRSYFGSGPRELRRQGHAA